MFKFFKSRADWRVLTGAALIGSGLGLGLGAVYLAGGMANHAVAYAHSRDLAAAAAEGYDGAPASAAFGQSVLGFWRAPQGGVATAALARQARAKELDCLAEAVYFEARGESARGQAAVAQVVMNRVRHPAFPKTVCAVVFQGVKRGGCQFSFACDGSMKASLEADAWGRARRVAARALAGVAVADIGKATHFHTAAVSPSWGLEMRRVTQVGEHIFYRFGTRKPGDAVRQAVVEKAVLTSGPAPVIEVRLMSAVIEKTLETAPSPAALAGEPVAPEAKPAPQPVATATSSQPIAAAS